jgi:hypothetical protein
MRNKAILSDRIPVNAQFTIRGNRNFAVRTLAVGFYRLRVKGEGGSEGEGGEDRYGCVWSEAISFR